MSQIRNVYNSSCVVLIHPNASWTFVLPSDRHKSISKIWPTHNLTKFGWNYWTVDGQGYSDLLKILTNFGRSTDLTPRIVVYGLLQNGFNFCRCLQQFAGFTQVNEISALQKKQFFFIASDKGMMHVSTADFILDDYQILINMDIDALKERNNLGKVDISDDLVAVLMLRELVGYRKRTREYGGYQRMTNNATSRSILEKDIFDSFKEKWELKPQLEGFQKCLIHCFIVIVKMLQLMNLTDNYASF